MNAENSPIRENSSTLENCATAQSQVVIEVRNDAGELVDTIRFADPVQRLCRMIESQGCETVVRQRPTTFDAE